MKMRCQEKIGTDLYGFFDQRLVNQTDGFLFAKL